ncbi:MAG: hypothetical protein AAGF96_14500 [Bacteroidota bacterium]
MISLEKINLEHPMDIGAPSPKIISDDINLTVLFYVDLFDSVRITDKVKERNIFVDSGTAILKFELCRIHKFGSPSDETISGHRYYDMGLDSYSFFIVHDSEWVKELKEIGSHHPYYNERSFDGFEHYIITFKDNTFECIAKNYSINFSSKPLKENLKMVTDNLI